MPRCSILILLTTFVLLVANSLPAHAQERFENNHSVELKAACSPLVVRAVIDDYTVDDLAAFPFMNCVVTVRVIETLRGEKVDSLSFVHYANRLGYDELSDLQKDRTEILLFMEPWIFSGHQERSDYGYAYSRFPFVLNDAVALALGNQPFRYASMRFPVCSATGEILETPDALLRTIRDYLSTFDPEKRLSTAKGYLPETPKSSSTGNGPWVREKRGTMRRFDATFRYPTGSFPSKTDGQKFLALTRPKFEAMTNEEAKLGFDELKTKFGGVKNKSKRLNFRPKELQSASVAAIELTANNSELIVRGVVQDSFHLGGAFYTEVVQLRVSETILGTPVENIVFVASEVDDPNEFDQLKQDGTEIVVFLVKTSLNAPWSFFSYRTENLWKDSGIVLAKDRAEVLSRDLSWIRDPDKIITKLRDIASDKAVATQTDIFNANLACCGRSQPVFLFQAPASVTKTSSLAEIKNVTFALPVDRQLERNAIKWTTSDDPHLRWLAARAMIYFNKDMNPEVLKTLLDDDSKWERDDVLRCIGERYKKAVPKYLVRWEAWQVLHGWGHDVPQPDFGIRE